MADAALRIGAARLVQESIVLVYPELGDEWIDEAVAPAAPAGVRTALDAERAAARFAGGGGTGVALRFGLFYGRAAFLLHDVFGYPFEKVARILQRTPAGVRQLASRARRRVTDGRPR